MHRYDLKKYFHENLISYLLSIYIILGSAGEPLALSGPKSCENQEEPSYISVTRDDCSFVRWLENGRKFVIDVDYSTNQNCQIVVENPDFLSGNIEADPFTVSTYDENTKELSIQILCIFRLKVIVTF